MLSNEANPTSPNSLMVLRSANNRSCVKTVFVGTNGRPAWRDYDLETHWTVEAYEVSNLRTLGDTLTALAERKDCIVIYGAPLGGVDLSQPVMRRKEGKDAAFQATERRWLAIDCDSVNTPVDLSVEEQVALVWREMLPDGLRSVSCYYQLTAGQGIKPGLRVRYWFWMDEPVHSEVLRMRFRSEPLIDASVFVAVQPIYVGHPRFQSGITDPVAGARCGFLKGSSTVVRTAELKLDEAKLDAESIRRNGMVINRLNVEPDRRQIEEAIDRILNQVTTGARHHHALGACAELYLLGAEVGEIIEVGNALIRTQGREPTDREVRDLLVYCERKAAANALSTTNPPLSAVLPTDDADLEVITDGDPEANRDLLEALEDYDDAASDHHNARVFVRKLCGPGNYIRTQQSDWVYNGKCWDRTDDEEVLGGELARSAGDVFSTAKITSLLKRTRLLHQHNIVEIPTWIGTEKPASGHAIVVNNGLLFVEDALVDSETALRPHNRDLFTPGALPYDYNPGADCPTWRRCVSEWFPGDAATQREFQKMIGYLLVPDNRYEKFFVLTDTSAGRSGKGTAMTVLKWLLGDRNVAATSLQGLGERFGLSQLVGRSVALINEANTTSQRDIPPLTIDRLKMVTGNDTVEVEFKRQSAYALKLPTRFVMSCNQIPSLSDPSGALLKRTHVIHFGQTFYGREDSTLKSERGALHAELSGILNWAIEGLAMLYYDDKQFVETESGKTAKRSFSRIGNPLRAFVEDCLEVCPVSEKPLSPSEVYEVYKAWCADQGIRYPKPRAVLWAAIEQGVRGVLIDGDYNLLGCRFSPQIKLFWDAIA